MRKGVIFDVDETLLDSMSIWEDAGARYLKSLGAEPEENLGKILYPMTIEEAAAYLKKQYHLEWEASRIVQGILDTVKEYYYREAPLKPRVKEALQKLQKKGVGITAATSGNREHIEAAFQRLGIAGYFQKIFTSSEVGVGKSNPLIYQEAAKFLGTELEETYVFEDVLYAIQTAKKAGFHTVGIYDQYSARDTEKIKLEAEFYLESMEHASEILENL